LTAFGGIILNAECRLRRSIAATEAFARGHGAPAFPHRRAQGRQRRRWTPTDRGPAFAQKLRRGKPSKPTGGLRPA
jgi:hypothetical protein